MKTQIVFWLLGAIDGHAKNFSLFLGSGGRFSLTPLYDVMSAQLSYARVFLSEFSHPLAMAFFIA